MVRTSDALSSWEAGQRRRAAEAARDAETARQLEEGRLSRAYCPQLPPPPRQRPVDPMFEDDPGLWIEAERAFGHMPAGAADVDAALARARQELTG